MTGKAGLSDDTRLVKECLRGNERAQRSLYERFSSKMTGVCYRYVRNKADAEDILQEGFIKVFTSLKQFQSKGSLEGWIRRIMINTAINFLNKNKKLRHSLGNETDERIASADHTDGALHRQDILNMLHQLPTGYRTIINLYAIEGYSHKEIGEMLDIAEVTSRSQYSRGKEMLMRIQAREEQIYLGDPKQKEQ